MRPSKILRARLDFNLYVTLNARTAPEVNRSRSSDAATSASLVWFLYPKAPSQASNIGHRAFIAPPLRLRSRPDLGWPKELKDDGFPSVRVAAQGRCAIAAKESGRKWYSMTASPKMGAAPSAL